jgi:hypothetical protein
VSMFRYAIEMPDAALARVGGRTYLTGGTAAGVEGVASHPVLVRREINMASGQPVPGTERVVLDSIAAGGFSVEAIVDNSPVPGTVTLTHTATPETLGVALSGTIRSLIITLITESAESAEGDQLARQRATAGRRAVRFEVMLPNAARNPEVF